MRARIDLFVRKTRLLRRGFVDLERLVSADFLVGEICHTLSVARDGSGEGESAGNREAKEASARRVTDSPSWATWKLSKRRDPCCDVLRSARRLRP